METISKISLTEKIASVIKEQVSISKLSSVDAMRKSAFDTFCTLSIPNRRDEEWKYATPEPLFKEDLEVAGQPPLKVEDIEQIKLKYADAYFIVTVNGYFDERLSSPSINDNIIVCSLKHAFKSYASLGEKHLGKYAASNDVFVALNNAAYTSGVFIFVKEGHQIEKPVYLLNVTSANNKILINSRNLVVIEKNASVQITEHFESIGSSTKSVRNHLLECSVSENAKVDYHVIQNDDNNASSINNIRITQHRFSNLNIHTLTFGGQYTRNNLHVEHHGENIESNLNGLFMGSDNQLIDNHTLVDHQQPNCNSNELYKGILNDHSTGVFNGKIFVRKDAQKTNAYQSSRNILLNDNSKINTKPQLEIYADDVKCSHGTSTGHMDEEAVFYLQARGIGRESAKLLLMHAFAGEVLDKIESEEVKILAEKLVSKKLLL